MDSYEGTKYDPQSLHKYLYTGNDPINKIDPSGKLIVIEALIAVAIIFILVGAAIYQYNHLQTSVPDSKRFPDLSFLFFGALTGNAKIDNTIVDAFSYLHDDNHTKCIDLFSNRKNSTGFVDFQLENFYIFQRYSLTIDTLGRIIDPARALVKINSQHENDGTITRTIIIHELLHVTNTIGDDTGGYTVDINEYKDLTSEGVTKVVEENCK